MNAEFFSAVEDIDKEKLDQVIKDAQLGDLIKSLNLIGISIMLEILELGFSG